MNAPDKGLHDFFLSLESQGEPRAASKPVEIKPEERHPCFECNGTGLYRGVRVHQDKSHCFACRGKGYHRKSYEQRQQSKARRQQRKVKVQQAAQDVFNERHPGLIDGLRAIASWHSFAASILTGFDKFGSLTDRQADAAYNALRRVEEKRKEREAEKASKSGEVSMAAIEVMFNTAKESGLKRPRFITERLKMELAKATGRNLGAIYVKCDGEYAGKIQGGQFLAVRSAPTNILDLVREIAASPIESARKYGRDTGTCSCCGRKLTDPTSVANGIGPICESNWGL